MSKIVKKAVKQPAKNMKNMPKIREVVRNFSGLGVKLRLGDESSKRRLANHLEIDIPSDRTTVSTRLTIRQARALQNMLNEYLK